ncbi:ATP-dependent DNA ligase [Bradyrhizobium sp. LB1.3]
MAEVKFAEWTSKGELRQPVYLGLRSDKKAKDVARERPRSRR